MQRDVNPQDSKLDASNLFKGENQNSESKYQNVAIRTS